VSADAWTFEWLVIALYKIIPLVLGQAQVGAVLDVFWSLTRAQGVVNVPVLAFLIEGGSSPILVDTGMRGPQRASEEHGLGPNSVSMEQTLAAQLARYGLTPADIETTLITHMHYDHAGGMDLLPNSRFIVQRSEVMAAAAPMGPRGLEVGSRDLFYDRKDIAAVVERSRPPCKSSVAPHVKY
jgi:N-acyl homoserine lactone hydrolase